MYKSASSELSAPAQARDHRLKANLRAALIGEQGLAGLTLSPEVLMERGYVIGRVETSDQAEAVRHVARGVSGLRSVDLYLPISQTSTGGDSSTVSDMTIHTEIATALRLAPGVVASRINVTVLDRQAVLLGVVSGDEERRHAIESVSGVEGVKGVTNWLLLPESDYMAVRPKLR
jgi:osmotically-inducible protein OsmY